MFVAKRHVGDSASLLQGNWKTTPHGVRTGASPKDPWGNEILGGGGGVGFVLPPPHPGWLSHLCSPIGTNGQLRAVSPALWGNWKGCLEEIAAQEGRSDPSCARRVQGSQPKSVLEFIAMLGALPRVFADSLCSAHPQKRPFVTDWYSVFIPIQKVKGSCYTNWENWARVFFPLESVKLFHCGVLKNSTSMTSFLSAVFCFLHVSACTIWADAKVEEAGAKRSNALPFHPKQIIWMGKSMALTELQKTNVFISTNSRADSPPAAKAGMEFQRGRMAHGTSPSNLTKTGTYPPPKYLYALYAFM